jgi:hypothetical protein
MRGTGLCLQVFWELLNQFNTVGSEQIHIFGLYEQKNNRGGLLPLLGPLLFDCSIDAKTIEDRYSFLLNSNTNKKPSNPKATVVFSIDGAPKLSKTASISGDISMEVSEKDINLLASVKTRLQVAVPGYPPYTMEAPPHSIPLGAGILEFKTLCHVEGDLWRQANTQ